ncbi:MAG TPA: hypothetical protein VGO68_07665 [Pyrinomonadaceae bacterium]|jgi:hypothetical protein|nr:hypothetical protein [Pyrinomonadaceae bacterium]
MNNQRWIILLAAAVLFCLSELMPPWIYRCESGYGHPAGYPAGYHFFLKPPPPQPICLSSDPLPAPLPAVFKNSLRVDAQRTVLISLTIGLLLVLRSPRTKAYVVTGVLALCVSALGLLFLGLMIFFEI